MSSIRLVKPEHGYAVFFEPADGGGYFAICPAFPGLITQGDTIADARSRVGEEIEVCIERLRWLDEPIPRTDLE